MIFFRITSDASSYYREDDSQFETLVSALFIKEDVPFLDLVLDRFHTLVWPSNKKVILIFCRLVHRDYIVNNFLSKVRANLLE